MDGSSLEGRDLRSVSSQRRDPVLADVFSRLQLMEHRGNGFKKILEDYDFQGHTTAALMPKFMAEHRDFLLILFNLNYIEGQDAENAVDKSSEKFGENSLNETQKSILRLIKEDKSVSASMMAERLDITQRAVEKNIKSLREQGILVRCGAARGGVLGD